MIEIERLADYLRWVAPSLVVLIGYPIMLILACWLTAAITRRFLTKRYEIQDRETLKAQIRELEAQIQSGHNQAEVQQQLIRDLQARIRENQALVSRLAMNYNIIDTGEKT